VHVCECVCVCVGVCVCVWLIVCLYLRRTTGGCNRCRDALGVQSDFTYSHDHEFLLDRQQMEFRGEYADW